MLPPRGERLVRLELHARDALAVGGGVLPVRHEAGHAGGELVHAAADRLDLVLDARLEPGAEHDDNHDASLRVASALPREIRQSAIGSTSRRATIPSRA